MEHDVVLAFEHTATNRYFLLQFFHSPTLHTVIRAIRLIESIHACAKKQPN